MKLNKLPQPARYSLWAFVLFLIIVLVFRHLASDQQQETRIETLEIQVAQLEAILEARGELPADSTRSTEPQATQAKTARPRKPATATKAKNDTTPTPTRTEKLAEKLTDNHKSKKFTTPVRLELNTIDSLTLIRVPGIADRTASTILAYRKRLGGFYSPEQLREKLTWDAAQEHMDEWCTLWFTADESLVQMLHINSLSFKEINRHPYISYEQTKALVRYRDKHKGIRSMAEIEQLAEFDEQTIEKLKHYISFK